MARKEPEENPNIPNINFIGFQKQITGIVKDIKHQNKKSGLKLFIKSKHENPHVDGNSLSS